MRIVSVNVGMPREVAWKGMTVRTSIFKEPVGSPVIINKLNLAGDSQADLTVHGGEEKAVYAYPAGALRILAARAPGSVILLGHVW